MKFLMIIFLFSIHTNSWPQRGWNIPQFDRRKIHFGAAIGIGTVDYRFKPKAHGALTERIVNVNIKKGPSFHMGIITSFNLNKMIHLRAVIPCLSFEERVFSYQYIDGDKIVLKEARLASTLLNFPLMLKLRSKRINNFAAYVLTGVQYSFDMASAQKAEIGPEDLAMKMNQHDFSTQFGGGFDFFMSYFKLAFELKVSNGFRELLIRENTLFANPLNSLKSKVWWFSITFEG